MKQVTMHQAKTQLSRLVRAVEAGEEVVILRGRVAVARLVPCGAEAPRRHKGALRGRSAVTDAFFAPLPPDFLAAFE